MPEVIFYATARNPQEFLIKPYSSSHERVMYWSDVKGKLGGGA